MQRNGCRGSWQRKYMWKNLGNGKGVCLCSYFSPPPSLLLHLSCFLMSDPRRVDFSSEAWSSRWSETFPYGARRCSSRSRAWLPSMKASPDSADGSRSSTHRAAYRSRMQFKRSGMTQSSGSYPKNKTKLSLLYSQNLYSQGVLASLHSD